jgi:hypothetical protein
MTESPENINQVLIKHFLASVDSFKKSAKVKTTAKKITRNKKTSSKKPIKKSGQRKGRKVRQQVAN